MTEAQARAKLQKLLAVTLERGAAPGEQANATRAIGAILQEHPSLRDMIIGVEDTARSPRPWQAAGPRRALGRSGRGSWLALAPQSALWV